MVMIRVPTAQGKQVKQREFGNFAKTQEKQGFEA